MQLKHALEQKLLLEIPASFKYDKNKMFNINDLIYRFLIGYFSGLPAAEDKKCFFLQ